MDDWHERLVRELSAERLDPYLKACDGDLAAALRVYAYNIELSAAFSGPLHIFEVVLRNALHGALAAHFRRQDWWSHPKIHLHRSARMMIDEADRTLRSKGKAVSPGRMVAELSLGFWVSLLGKGENYETQLWRPALRFSFSDYQGPVRPLHEELNTVRLLRNRISHLEPIHHRDLIADRRKILRIVGYISGSAVDFIQRHDRVRQVIARRRAVCDGEAAPTF